MLLSRRSALLTPLLLAACGGDGPPRTYPPLRYDFLTPLRLNVATVDIAPLPPPGPLDGTAPIAPSAALRSLAEDRLTAGGSSGRGLVTIDEARVVRAGGGLDGTMGMHLDILAADGTRAGFAEARVTRRVGNVGRDVRGSVYDLTKQMLDDMNVELEFQIRRSLKDYLQTTGTAPTPAPVQKQDLGAPAI